MKKLAAWKCQQMSTEIPSKACVCGQKTMKEAAKQDRGLLTTFFPVNAIDQVATESHQRPSGAPRLPLLPGCSKMIQLTCQGDVAED